MKRIDCMKSLVAVCKKKSKIHHVVMSIRTEHLEVLNALKILPIKLNFLKKKDLEYMKFHNFLPVNLTVYCTFQVC